VITMLTRTIIFPCIFTSESFQSPSVTLLQDILKSGVIFLDYDDKMWNEILKNIGNWNQDFKKEVQKILEQLDKNKRIVRLSISEQIYNSCNNPLIGDCENQIQTDKDFFALVALRRECVIPKTINQKLTTIDKYVLSKLRDSLNTSGFVLSSSEWRQDDFEKKILIPLFRDAKHIKVFDRWIGRSVPQGQSHHQATLWWLVEVFQKFATIRTDTIFEVYCGIDCRKLTQAKISGAVKTLRQFEAEMIKLFPYFKLFIKNEVSGNQLPHDRYLITNQTAIYIGRGFDLFVDTKESYPRRIKDVQIGYCSNPEKVEPFYRKLPDL
jgi:hypothetical protein